MPPTIMDSDTCAELKDPLVALQITLSQDRLALCDEVHQDFYYPMG